MKSVDQPNKPTPFDRLMRGLIAVPRDELDAEIRREQAEKERENTPAKPPKRKR